MILRDLNTVERVHRRVVWPLDLDVASSLLSISGRDERLSGWLAIWDDRWTEGEKPGDPSLESQAGSRPGRRSFAGAIGARQTRACRAPIAPASPRHRLRSTGWLDGGNDFGTMGAVGGFDLTALRLAIAEAYKEPRLSPANGTLTGLG